MGFRSDSAGRCCAQEAVGGGGSTDDLRGHAACRSGRDISAGRCIGCHSAPELSQGWSWVGATCELLNMCHCTLWRSHEKRPPSFLGSPTVSWPAVHQIHSTCWTWWTKNSVMPL